MSSPTTSFTSATPVVATAPGVSITSPSSAVSSVEATSSSNAGSNTAVTPADTNSQLSPSSTTHPLSSSLSTTFASSISSSSHKSSASASTAAPQSSASLSSAHTPSAVSSTHRLSNGAVAGIVIAVALGIALLTFLATFFIMRRQKQSKGDRRYQSSEDSELRTPRKQDQTPIPKKPFVTEASEGSRAYESYLPQSADDSTVRQKTKAILDQLELHVENFYRKSSSSAPRIDNAELAVFDSPYLPASLASLLPRSKNKLNVIKHALALFVTSSISPSSNPARSLLPPEYALLPNTVTKATSTVPTKAGEFNVVSCGFMNGQSVAKITKGSAQIMSQWRVMTAYLRPDPAKDAAYIAQRDRQISDTVQSFGKAFTPWKSPGYKDEERARSLSAILEEAANLGIFLFSQPSTLGLHWPSASEVGPGRIIVSPALVKATDEKGKVLVEAQVIVNEVVLDA